MKNSSRFLIVLAAFFSTFVVFRYGFAQDQASPAELFWTSVVERNFTESGADGWAQGRETLGTTAITREMTTQGYRWRIQSPAQEFSLLPIPEAPLPDGYSARFSIEFTLPVYDPPICTGISLGQKTGENDVFMVCNDQTYSIMRWKNDAWEVGAPFAATPDFDLKKPIKIAVQLIQGWAEFSLNGQFIDVFPVTQFNGIAGLFAQPLSVKETEIIFHSLEVGISPAAEEEAPSVVGLPLDLMRMIRMLQIKDRVSSTPSAYFALSNWEGNLAQMGYFKTQSIEPQAENILIQADIAWKSAYEKPDIINAGCGFTFRAKDDANFLQTYLSMDGNVYVRANRAGQWIPIITYAVGKWSLTGGGTLTVVADEAKISVLYDQRLLGTIHNATWMGGSGAGLSVFSGTNFDYGTACSFTDGHVVVLK